MPTTATRRLALATVFLATVFLAIIAPTAAAIDVTAEDAASLKAAQAAYDSARYADAVNLLAPLAAKYPVEPDIPRMLTHAYFELGDYDRARQSALAAIAAGRLSADVLGRIAQIDQHRHDHVAVLNVVRLLTVVDPENRQWRLVYADLLAAAESLEESAAVYRALLDEQPASADVTLRLGNVLLKQQRFAEAAATLETAWRLGATDERLPRVIASAWQSLGDDRQSLAWLQRANATQDDPQLALHIAQTHFTLGDLDRAAAAATLLTASSTVSITANTNANIPAQAHVLLGRIATAQGNVDQAVAHWKQAAQAGQANPQLLAVLGAHYYNSGDDRIAARILRRVVDDQSDELDADTREQCMRFLIASLIRSADATAAREYLRQYIEQHGLTERAKTLVRSLATTNKKPVGQAKRPTDSQSPYNATRAGLTAQTRKHQTRTTNQSHFPTGTTTSISSRKNRHSPPTSSQT